MDSDQEVVREPFDDQGDYEQEHETNNYNSNEHHINEASSTRSAAFREADQTDRIYQNDSSDEQETSDEEQEKLARQYSIELKKSGRKRRRIQPDPTAYERLLNSEHVSSSSNVADNEHEKQAQAALIKTSITTDCLYHKGNFYQKGDIVAMCDQDDGQIYFAQLTGFLQDQYCEKSASVNWLVPIRKTSRKIFEPSAYRIGLEDEHLRKLDCMTFVRHCPHDYYMRKLFDSETCSEPTEINVKQAKGSKKQQSFIWTTMEPCRVPAIEPKS